MIIRSGHNIDPGLIEEALLRHPDVLLAAAVGEPDEYAGEVPVAFVVLEARRNGRRGELLAFIEPHIAERPAVPKRIELLPALPLTAIGKVYKPALRARAIEHVLRERLSRDAATQGVQVAVLDEAKAACRGAFIRRNTAAEPRERMRAAIARLMAAFRHRLPHRAVSAEATSIRFWFDFISPYGYLASLRIDELAARHGRTVDWHPLLVGVTVLRTDGTEAADGQRR